MHPVEKAIQQIREGKLVIVIDDHQRENEGDLIIAADKITPEAIAFMVRHTTGIICVSLPGEHLDRLQIPLMVTENTESHRTAFTVSVDYRFGTTTGVSAQDRCTTIKALISPNARPTDFCRPGHIFPLRYRPGGVLRRPGHTEAAVDLAQMAGLSPAGVLCEIVNDDGSMARLKDLEKFAHQHHLHLISVADLISYRRSHEKHVQCIAKARLPTEFGEFTTYVYESTIDHIQHLVLVKGNIQKATNVLVRMHSECVTGDVFRSRRCDCGSQLSMAMQRIADEGTGVIIYLRGQEGRGIGISQKLLAYNLQDDGKDTVEANIALGFPPDKREYEDGAQILFDLGVKSVRLMTNNPDKYSSLKNYQIHIEERVPILSSPHEDNRSYLMAKQLKLGHMLEI